MIVLLALLVFCGAVGIDYAHARYVQALGQHRAHMAARWSVVQWTAGSIAFVVAVKVTVWILPAEACGLYVGTWLACRRKTDGVAP